MREQEVKEIISVEILKRMQDQSAAHVLREILFDSDNNINWDKAGNSIIKNMPELKMFYWLNNSFILSMKQSIERRTKWIEQLRLL